MISVLTPDAVSAAKIVAAAIDRLSGEIALSRMQFGITINQGVEKVDEVIQKLVDAVSAQTTVAESAVTLLKGLHDQLVSAQGDPAKIQAAIDGLQANTQSLADAVVANTL